MWRQHTNDEHHRVVICGFHSSNNIGDKEIHNDFVAHDVFRIVVRHKRIAAQKQKHSKL